MGIKKLDRVKFLLIKFFCIRNSFVGKEATQKIKLFAIDQHPGFAKSVKAHCFQAVVVWDRFHLMQNFEEAVNEVRKDLHAEQPRGSDLNRLTRDKYRFMFLKKAARRTEEEKAHIDDIFRANERFAKLELIKERMLTFFDQPNEDEAKKVFEEIGDWIFQCGFTALMKWHNNLEKGWQTLRNYFRFRVTSALSEGVNNAIKMLKRRDFGYRNMEYFRFKIMQVCGYLNSKYIYHLNQLLAQNC